MSINATGLEILRRLALGRNMQSGTAICLGTPQMHGRDGSRLDAAAELAAIGYRHVVVLDAAGECDVTQDLNMPAPAELENTADLLIDPGTLEHVFDVRQAFENVCRCVKVGGGVFHVSPVNLVDHGFYNFCPALFAEAYAANGFAAPEFHMHQIGGGCRRVEYNHRLTRVCSSARRVVMYTTAVKVRDVRPFQVPQQGRYSRWMWLEGGR